MKKRKIVCAAMACLLLAGCKQTISTIETQEPTQVTTQIPTQTSPQNVTEPVTTTQSPETEREPLNLYNDSPKEDVYFGCDFGNVNYYSLEVTGPDTMVNNEPDGYRLCFSRQLMHERAADFTARQLYYATAFSEDRSAYSVTRNPDEYHMIWNPEMEEGWTPLKVVPDCITYSFHMESKSESISLKGFVHQIQDAVGDDYYEIIIDPAYMNGIPVFRVQSTADYKYEINERTIYADTLSFTVRKDALVNPSVIETAQGLSESYVYASFSIDSLDVKLIVEGIYPDTKKHYENTANCINELQIINEDASYALDHAEDLSAGDTSTLGVVYNALIRAEDILRVDNTYGIHLLDLDFDGMPEVIRTYTDGTRQCSISDVYRIVDGNLLYIDTIQLQTENDYSMPIYERDGLALTKDDDGEAVWLAYERKEESDVLYKTGYYYRLVGNRIEKEVVFCDELASSDENVKKFGDFYVGGEKVVPELSSEKSEYGSDVYKWKEYQGYSEANVISNYIEAQYADTTFYGLNSGYWGQDKTKCMVTSREYAYRMADMVDAFFLGKYDEDSYNYSYYENAGKEKPVIYLYPEEETELDVTIEFPLGGGFTCTYPEYTDGWHVTAMPDGTLYDEDGNEYYCLYWEGAGPSRMDNSRGFCVKGSDTAAFLREKLMYIGLSARETNEFIIYWLPILQKNPYNIISLHTEDYVREVPMNISTKPDSSIRVFMTYEPSDTYVEVAAQVLPHYERFGFTVVEWGGGIAVH